MQDVLRVKTTRDDCASWTLIWTDRIENSRRGKAEKSANDEDDDDKNNYNNNDDDNDDDDNYDDDAGGSDVGDDNNDITLTTISFLEMVMLGDGDDWRWSSLKMVIIGDGYHWRWLSLEMVIIGDGDPCKNIKQGVVDLGGFTKKYMPIGNKTEIVACSFME